MMLSRQTNLVHSMTDDQRNRWTVKSSSLLPLDDRERHRIEQVRKV